MATAKTAAELRQELVAAEDRERAESRSRKEATPPRFEYWVTPANPTRTSSYGKLYDQTCFLYELKRTITNREDARAVGWTDDDMKEGTGTYLYNTVTRRIVGAVGGGTFYITNNVPFGAEDFADDTAFFHIGAFLAEFPGGGDITYIVEDFKAARKAASNGKA
jgi:hypothetical protein